MADSKQIHLVGSEGFSWRGVRMRDLDPDDTDEAAIVAAKDCMGDNRRYMYINDRQRLLRAIVAVTPPGVGLQEAKTARAEAMVVASKDCEAALKAAQATKVDGPALQQLAADWAVKVAAAGDQAADAAAAAALIAVPPTGWISVTMLDMVLKDHRHAFQKLFKPKDVDILRGFIRKLYDARQDEAELIMGKALAVSTD